MKTASVIVLVVLALLITLGVYVIKFGVPFIEGTTVHRTGSAYSFTVGMTRDDAERVVRSAYTSSRIVGIVRNPKPKTVAKGDVDDGRLWNEIRAADKWMVIRRSKHVMIDSIDLDFDKDRVISISRTVWLFERP